MAQTTTTYSAWNSVMAESVGLSTRIIKKIEEFSDTCSGFVDYPWPRRPFLGSPSVAKQSLGPAIIHENQVIIVSTHYIFMLPPLFHAQFNPTNSLR